MRCGRSSALLVAVAVSALLLASAIQLRAADSTEAKRGEPTNAKARKTYAEAIEWEQHRSYGAAMDSFRKANQQDGGHCSECLQRAYILAIRISAYKDAEDLARTMLADANTPADKAFAHYRIAIALQNQGVHQKKQKCFADSCPEFQAAIDAQPTLAPAHYALGVSLARINQDDQARHEFSTFLEQDKSNAVLHERAQRYLDRIELARATMAPPFSLVTLDGQRISMDSLAGKVVLIDFWATWCGPCREALPRIRQIAHKFAGQPLVVLSISLDTDDAKWKDFVAKNNMTWLQYRDGAAGGRIANQFGVHAIPATFTIDADGVLEDQHVGDADIEGKIRKLVARAAEQPVRRPLEADADKDPTGTN